MKFPKLIIVFTTIFMQNVVSQTTENNDKLPTSAPLPYNISCYPKAALSNGKCVDHCSYLGDLVPKDTDKIKKFKPMCWCFKTEQCENMNAGCIRPPHDWLSTEKLDTRPGTCKCSGIGHGFSSVAVYGENADKCVPLKGLGDHCEMDEDCRFKSRVSEANFFTRRFCFSSSDDVKQCCFLDSQDDTVCSNTRELGKSCDSSDQCQHIGAKCILEVCSCDQTTFDKGAIEYLIGLDDNGRRFCKCPDGSVDSYNGCMKKLLGLGDICREDKHCEHLLPEGRVTCELIEGREERVCKISNCRQFDQYGQFWESEPLGTASKPCPFGSTSYWSYWSCGPNGEFNGTSPDFQECRSDWVENVVNIIKNSTKLNYELALKCGSSMLGNLTHSGRSNEIFAEEIVALLNAMQLMSTKFIPANDSDVFALSNLLVKSMDKLLDSEHYWKYLGDSKSHTFSKMLETLQFVPLTILDKSCHNANCGFPYKLNKTEVNKGKGQILFPSNSRRIKGAESFISVKSDKYIKYLGHTLNITYLLKYSSRVVQINGTEDSSYETNSDLLSFNWTAERMARVVSKDDPVEVTLKHSRYSGSPEVVEIQRQLHKDQGEEPTAVGGSAQCVFWDHVKEQWSTDGCSVLESSGFSTTCKCDHLSSFTIMVKIRKYIGKCRLLVGLLLTLFTLFIGYLFAKIFMYKSELVVADRSQIIRNLGFILTFACYGIVFFLADKHFYFFREIVCYRIGLLGHFALIMVVALMTVEITLHSLDYMNLKQFETLLKWAQSRPHISYLGVPFVISMSVVLVTVMIDTYDGPNSRAYGGEFCWVEGLFVYALYVPMWFLHLLNYGVLIYTIIKHRYTMDETTIRTLSKGDVSPQEIIDFVKNGMITNTLVAVTWLVGFFSFGPHYISSTMLSWLFPLLFTTQAYFMDKLIDKEGFLAMIKIKIITLFVKLICRKRLENKALGIEGKSMLGENNQINNRSFKPNQIVNRKMIARVSRAAQTDLTNDWNRYKNNMELLNEFKASECKVLTKAE